MQDGMAERPKELGLRLVQRDSHAAPTFPVLDLTTYVPAEAMDRPGENRPNGMTWHTSPSAGQT